MNRVMAALLGATVSIALAAAPALAAAGGKGNGNNGNGGSGGSGSNNGGGGGASNGNNGGGTGNGGSGGSSSNNGGGGGASNGNNGGGTGNGGSGGSGSGSNNGGGGGASNGNNGDGTGNGGSGGSGSNNGGGGGGNTGGSRACALSDISPGASACSGFISSNLLNNSKTAEQQSALTQIGFTWDGNFNAITKINSLNGATLVNFGPALFGDTFVGFHFGNGAGLGDQATGFYRFDAGQTGITSFDLNILQGSSGAILYKTGIFNGGGGGGAGNVPEPSTWMTLIAGFTLLGLAARRRRNKLAAA